MVREIWRAQRDLILIGLFVVMIAAAVVFNSSTAGHLASVIAIVGFLIVQQPDTSEVVDERHTFISHRASSLSFMLALTAVVFLSVLADFVPAIEEASVGDVLAWLMAGMYMTFTVTFAVLKRRY